MSKRDKNDAPGLLDKLVPGMAAMGNDVFARAENVVREPVVTHELPDIFGWVQFRALWRQRHESDVGRDNELRRQVPNGLVD